MRSSALVESSDTGGTGPVWSADTLRAVSPTMMNSASGSSLPMVRKFTTHALCRMPRTLIRASAAMIAVRKIVRDGPAVTDGQ